MALDKRAWRCQKGHGAQEKGHGAAPCYFALDLTLHDNQVHNHPNNRRRPGIGSGLLNYYVAYKNVHVNIVWIKNLQC